ncbi:CDP-glycerol glycerophosphotransferase family protein [Gillisia sp. M10.2A]|uniref:CDP-glycerol glycerophosphotransferase family protein n=1 Tax=Gillisia lutea TaxID=2909668 RepID=A0ABS9EEN7_9FLAO|nr:UDP-N-acetylglucosamine 2-epimerase [Gillisia lutea]MCF4101335.1 CDP-glycerol glycerophosphotransferase family protein [Gillisia lutea]
MKYRFLINISHTYALPIGAPLQKEILQRGYEVKWFSDLEYTKKSFPEHGELLPTIQDAVLYNPHVVLCITNDVADFIPGIKVQIFHGFSADKRSKAKGHFRIRGFFDLYCTQGPSTTTPFLELQNKYKHFEVKETGWSKVDPLFPIKYINTVHPTILVSSTFTPRLSLAHREEVLLEIENLSKVEGWKFIIVLHPKMEKKIVDRVKAMENDSINFYNTTNLIPLMQKADVMFSDTTSAITEFILQKRPVVTFRNNKPGNYLLDIQETSEIRSAIKEALSKPKQLMNAIDANVAKMHPYSDGNSSKRVIDACIDFLHEDKSHLKAKPLNLIRKYKIRKRLKYFTFKTYPKAPTLKK